MHTYAHTYIFYVYVYTLSVYLPLRRGCNAVGCVTQLCAPGEYHIVVALGFVHALKIFRPDLSRPFFVASEANTVNQHVVCKKLLRSKSGILVTVVMNDMSMICPQFVRPDETDIQSPSMARIFLT